MGESTFTVRGVRIGFSFLFHFSMKIIQTNRIAPDGTPRFAASRLGLFCLPMSHKKDTRLLWVNFMLRSFHTVPAEESNMAPPESLSAYKMVG